MSRAWGCFSSGSAGEAGEGDGGVFDRVVVGEVVADNRRYSLASIESEPLGRVEFVVVKGWRFAEFEFDLLKNPDITFFMPEAESDDFSVGLFCIGVFGVCATGDSLSFPVEGGGVGEVFSINGGWVCKAPYAGAVPLILS